MGDFDLTEGPDYWDPHAVAGLLKGYFRELPSSILTHERHFRFLKVIDFADPDQRLDELSSLISSLPLPNYCLLRALCAHLILIVSNASLNRMNVRNVGIVFSPTLGIPAGVFSMMLSDFPRAFGVEDDGNGNLIEKKAVLAAPEISTPDEELDIQDDLAHVGMTNGEATPRSRRGEGGKDSLGVGVPANKRNSVGYAEASADRLLGLGGRVLASE